VNRQDLKPSNRPWKKKGRVTPILKFQGTKKLKKARHIPQEDHSERRNGDISRGGGGERRIQSGEKWRGRELG